MDKVEASRPREPIAATLEKESPKVSPTLYNEPPSPPEQFIEDHYAAYRGTHFVFDYDTIGPRNFVGETLRSPNGRVYYAPWWDTMGEGWMTVTVNLRVLQHVFSRMYPPPVYENEMQEEQIAAAIVNASLISAAHPPQ